MSVNQGETFSLPITALAFLQLDRLYILAGEGPYLKVYDRGTNILLLQEQVFDSQAIHGIICQTLPCPEGSRATLLIWGGQSICVLELWDKGKAVDDLGIRVSQLRREILVEDRILGSCLQDPKTLEDRDGRCRFSSFLVTAHNELNILELDLDPAANKTASHSVSRIASGLHSVLFSAHVILAQNGRVLVAAGTVFGEVLIWSCQLGNNVTEPCPHLHHSFIGHEGSVFGVRISEEVVSGSPKRVVATCSDDRTIRLWDISKTNVDPQEDALPTDNTTKSGFLVTGKASQSRQCLASTMGHASRIWGLRFLNRRADNWEVISHGEDSSAQLWQLSTSSEGETSDKEQQPSMSLSHQATHSHHSGKNLWAIAVQCSSSGGFDVATGGADGKIVSYRPDRAGSALDSTMFLAQSIIEEAVFSTESLTQDVSSKTMFPKLTLINEIFNGFDGHWKLYRKIQSVEPTYPSGTFNGSASFKERHVTDPAYSAEYLYTESGEFVTTQGLQMRATRQYLYRYNKTKDVISVWFVKTDDSSTADYLFHEVAFSNVNGEVISHGANDSPARISASGHHLCIQDEYMPEYTFRLKSSGLENWELRFRVLGPKKHYTTHATYVRDIRGQSLLSDLPNPTDSVPEVRQSMIERSRIHKSIAAKPDAFKTYAWMSPDEFLATTEQGNILIGSINSKRKLYSATHVAWLKVAHQPELKSSCIATSLPPLGLAFLTGKDGTIFLYSHSSKRIRPIHKLSGKAGFVSSDVIFDDNPYNRSESCTVGVITKCLGSFEMAILICRYIKDPEEFSLREVKMLDVPAGFIVTSSLYDALDKMLIVGSRSGDLAFYNLEDFSVDESKGSLPTVHRGIHGSESVTTIELLDRHGQNLQILTVGRDGRFAIHKIAINPHNDSVPTTTIQTLHTGVPPFGPNIEGICIDNDNLYLWGFRSKQFIVWNETQKLETMTVECGGAHRNWAYNHRKDGRGGGSFVWTKASVCHVVSQPQASHRVLQHGGHGREIKAVALSPPMDSPNGSSRRLLATGAEDTAIRIFDASSSSLGSKCLSIITKHTSGLQKLQWSSDGQLLFSAAGCEEFFAWRIRPAPIVTIGVVCEVQCPRVTEEGDLRIMDFALCDIHTEDTKLTEGQLQSRGYLISMVYSDSSVRIFKYQGKPAGGTFTLLCEATYITHCLTQCLYIHTTSTLHLCTASTDGHLAFWPLSTALSHYSITYNRKKLLHTTDPHTPQQPTQIEHIKRLPIHQNSIKTMTAAPLPLDDTLLITGGDDGAVAFTRLNSLLDTPTSTSTLLIPKAHASAVTAITSLSPTPTNTNTASHAVSYRFASVGNDQRLKTWVVSIDQEQDGVMGMKVMRETDVPTAVADASSLDVDIDEEGRKRVVVAGIGMESWAVGDGGMEVVNR